MMWEAAAQKMRVVRREHSDGLPGDRLRIQRAHRDAGACNFCDPRGRRELLEAEHVISSAPLRELIRGLSPAVPDRVRQAAERLKYRDFLTVMLIVSASDAFSDNWIYIHDPSGEGRPDPEFPFLVAGDGARAG